MEEIKLLDNKNVTTEHFNNVLTVLRHKMYQAIVNEDRETERNEINDQVEQIRISFARFEKLDAENMIFYLNNNSKFGTKAFYKRSRDEKNKVLDKLLKLDMNRHENILQMSDFLMWAPGLLYEDKDMCKLVKLFCDNTSLEHSNLIFHIKSVLLSGAQERCKSLIINKSKEIKRKEIPLSF